MTSSLSSLPDEIQRILYITPKVHVFQVPPLQSNTKGHTAAIWTQNQPIFTARLRIVESASRLSPNPQTSSGPAKQDDGQERFTVAILLEDSSSGELFAAAPYTHPSTVEQCHDSSRFFAVRVVGGGDANGRGQMKATLGIGFEERSDAFDFGVTLQDAGKLLGFMKDSVPGSKKKEVENDVHRDYSLKEGQTITVNIGGRGAAPRKNEQSSQDSAQGAALPFIPPPPASSSRDRRRIKHEQAVAGQKQEATAAELGFDDGDFGEFQ